MASDSSSSTHLLLSHRKESSVTSSRSEDTWSLNKQSAHLMMWEFYCFGILWLQNSLLLLLNLIDQHDIESASEGHLQPFKQLFSFRISCSLVNFLQMPSRNDSFLTFVFFFITGQTKSQVMKPYASSKDHWMIFSRLSCNRSPCRQCILGRER